MHTSDKVPLGLRPERYWTEDQEPVLELLKAIASDCERELARDLFRDGRFEDLERLLVQRQILLPDGRINKDYQSLDDIWEDRLEEITTEPVCLASMTVDGFPMSSSSIQAQRVGWTIRFRYTGDDGMDEALDEDTSPCTLGDILGWCVSVVEELRSCYAGDYSLDELEGRWCFTSSSSLYPGLDEALEAEEKAWLERTRKERAEDEMLE